MGSEMCIRDRGTPYSRIDLEINEPNEQILNHESSDNKLGLSCAKLRLTFAKSLLWLARWLENMIK